MTQRGILSEKATPLRRSYFLLKPSAARFGKIDSTWSLPKWTIPDRSPENSEGTRDLRVQRGPLLDLTYIEWLNGLPPGWISSLPDFPPSETQAYLEWRAQSLAQSTM